MKVETTLPLQKEARILQFTKDKSLASFQWCLLRIARNYPLQLTKEMFTWKKLLAWHKPEFSNVQRMKALQAFNGVYSGLLTTILYY